MEAKCHINPRPTARDNEKNKSIPQFPVITVIMTNGRRIIFQKEANMIINHLPPVVVVDSHFNLISSSDFSFNSSIPFGMTSSGTRDAVALSYANPKTW